ncbi:hypothetical protein FC756_00900 [Lysinibacillus mangiferihumi]|uniref:Uncharacterized protein n=1 Tax=Lysinibacillus mangiferihumi TaxID=1130819 RepID=A0A4U2ZE52_9BACI|nr:hypothetical protein [Lysinibacillus mangiferihumi]TKI72654.1 hypothetical protein FC756_00900 [Lysinibacillus mangiferihumi]
MQVHERLINLLFQTLLSHVRKGRFLIDGTERNIEIFRTERLGNTLRVMFYLNDYHGHVTYAALLDNQGEILVDGPTNFYKEHTGFMYVFDIPITVEGGGA